MGNQKKVKGFFRRLLNYMVFIVVSIFLVNGVTEFTYATDQVPNVIVDIKDRQITQKGNLYGDDLWYPGNEVSGIIRINNNDITPCAINSLGINVNMTTNSGIVYNSFLDNMKLTIEKGSLLNFGDVPLADAKSLADLCDNGIKLKGSEQLIVTKNNPLDLKYTLLMDMDSGNELQNVTATIDFLINVSGEETAVGEDSSSNNNSRNRSTTNNNPELDEEVTPVLPIVIEKVGLEDERFLKIEFPLPEEDDAKIIEQRNVGLKITSMVEDEEQEQVVATCILGEGNNVLNLNEIHYPVKFNVKDHQFEPNVTYTAYLYDVDTGEKLLKPISFTVDTASANQSWEQQ